MTTEREKKSQSEEVKKRKKLRYNEYYNIQSVFDNLYEQSKQGSVFKNLYNIITSRENILLAYRNIKANRGSKTRGSDYRTILDVKAEESDKVVELIRNKLLDYKPKPVRRVNIPKPNGKLRPLGIPCIDDRIIQQAFLQVLEPICEAKFHNDSYGFRPNRSTHHAIAKCYNYVNVAKQYYVVDMDIEGFFDNVDHGKLLKQLWTLGIRDKRVLSIISKMLKTPIEEKGRLSYPTKGTPQGGILSPLLANINLNEFDWWISEQWLDFPATQRKSGKGFGNFSGKEYKNNSNKLNALRTHTKLKPCFIVRYADDFKIFTDSYQNAQKLMIATEKWLKERLKLNIGKDKSKIVNLKKEYSDFLGIKFRAKFKNENGKTRYVINSCMQDKQKERIIREIDKKIREVADDETPSSMYKLNSLIMGVHNYYGVATNINGDFNDIEHKLYRKIKYQWLKRRKCAARKGQFSATYLKHYGEYRKRKQFFVKGIALYPISGVGFKRPTVFNKNICNYTAEGRKLVHDGLISIDNATFKHIMKNPVINMSVEYNDNRISLYCAQGGKCAITGLPLTVGNMHCHHKIPKYLKGTDQYSNLIYVIKDIHLLIHSNKDATQKRIINQYSINAEQLKKINKLRLLVGNYNITKEKAYKVS